ncbi:MAG: polysaccharide deacetylase family protein [Deltaproteobacteria bacterium]|nr:polysaccharide deacetylase family protein [Deltaproteobacteria bacterium]
MNARRTIGELILSVVVFVFSLASIDAYAQIITYTLTITTAGNGRTFPVAGTYTYDEGTEVTLIAIVAPGDAFIDWSGDISSTAKQISVVMNADISVTATFVQGKSPVSMLPNPPGVGVPRPNGAPENLTVLDWAGFTGAVSYTFDDSLDSQIENYATLKAPGVPMTFYLNPTTESAYSDEQRAAAFRQWQAEGHELGNHTYNHCEISAAGVLEPGSCLWTFDSDPPTGATWQSELSDTATWIIDTVGQYGVWSMAAPYGDDDWGTFAQATPLLFHRGLWEGMLWPYDLVDQYSMPAFLAAGTEWGGLDDRQETFEQVIDNARANASWALLVFHQIDPANDNIGCCLVPAVNITGSMQYLKALNDVWGDTVAKIGSYWVAQEFFSAITPTTRGSTMTWTWSLPANFPRHSYLRVLIDGGTLRQNGRILPWDEHGYYEISLEEGSLTLLP